MLIELRKITKRYGTGESLVWALREVNLSVEEQEFVSIMGKSGCGKTTLLNILGTSLCPDGGTYLFDGEDVGGFGEKQLAVCKRRKIAHIFQSYNLVEELTVRNNITLPFVFDRREYEKDFLETIVQDLDIGHIMDKYPSQLSGGEKQRAAVARALLVRPRVILADEPTGNLDYENAAGVMGLLRRCVEDYRQTVVLVTHDSEMADYADRTLHMKDGSIVA